VLGIVFACVWEVLHLAAQAPDPEEKPCAKFPM
jgi:hypothetical protein